MAHSTVKDKTTPTIHPFCHKTTGEQHFTLVSCLIKWFGRECCETYNLPRSKYMLPCRRGNGGTWCRVLVWCAMLNFVLFVFTQQTARSGMPLRKTLIHRSRNIALCRIPWICISQLRMSFRNRHLLAAG